MKILNPRLYGLEVLGALGPEWDDDAVDELLSCADATGDGELQVEEPRF